MLFGDHPKKTEYKKIIGMEKYGINKALKQLGISGELNGICTGTKWN